MHHLLPFYGKHQRKFLKIYIGLAKLTKMPVIGRLVRWLANIYARRQHGGFIITVKDAEDIIDASSYIKLGPCSCRQVFRNCDRPIMSELVVGAGREVYADVDKDSFTAITKEEAKKLIKRFHNMGMIHTIMHSRGQE